jgi:transposase-like protein
MIRGGRFSAEMRERAVRLAQEHEHENASQWAAIPSVASKIECSGETLRSWVRQVEWDCGRRPGRTSEERQRLKELKRNREPSGARTRSCARRSAYFAQAELDHRAK